MSEITTRLCAEHRHIPGTHLPDRCSCGWEADDGTAGTWQQHFAQAIEAAIRDHVAREIEEAEARAVRTDLLDRWGTALGGRRTMSPHRAHMIVQLVRADAARIARRGAS